MTTMQRVLFGAALTAAIGTGIYQIRQSSNLQEQVRALQQQEAAQVESLERLNRERDEVLGQRAALQQENERLRQAAAEMPKLRGEVARLRALAQQSGGAKSAGQNLDDPFTQSVLGLVTRAAELNRHLEQRPERRIPELQLLTESDWLTTVKDAKLDSDVGVRKALRQLRSLAKQRLPLGSALFDFTRANNGQLPTDLSQLKPYFKIPIDETVFERYKLLHTGKVSDFPAGTYFIAEKAPVDKEYDSRAKFGVGTSSVSDTGLGESGDPEDPSY